MVLQGGATKTGCIDLWSACRRGGDGPKGSWGGHKKKWGITSGEQEGNKKIPRDKKKPRGKNFLQTLPF